MISDIEALAWLDAYNDIHDTDYFLYDMEKRCYKSDNLILVMYVDGDTIDGIFIYGKINRFIIPDIIETCAKQEDINTWIWQSRFSSSRKYDTAINLCNGTKFFGDNNWVYRINRSDFEQSRFYSERIKRSN